MLSLKEIYCKVTADNSTHYRTKFPFAISNQSNSILLAISLSVFWNKNRFLCVCTGIQLLTLLVPILISYLIDSHQMKNSTKYSRQLHDQSLQWLMRIGPKYPQEFKALMGQTTELRVKLETAIRHSQQNTSDKLKNDLQSSAKQQMNQQKPTIELKTNFSNFSSSK